MLRTRTESAVVITAALISASLIFGALYDVLDGALRHWTDRDLAHRARVIATAVNSAPALRESVRSFPLAAGVDAVVACGAGDTLIAAAQQRTPFACGSAIAREAVQSNGTAVHANVRGQSVAVTAHHGGDGGTLFIVQDRTFVAARRKHLLIALFAASELALLAFLLLSRAGARIGARRTSDALRSMIQRIRSGDSRDLPPLTGELRLLARDVEETVDHLCRTATTRAGRARRLRAAAGTATASRGLVVVANCEPYKHEWTEEKEIAVRRPASGLVTAIEPILRACGGTWIAYGGGAADRTATPGGRIAVPPGRPEYDLRRLFIDPADYDRYYLGCANEALWPLCHRAHAQPVFRRADWNAYRSVNEAFAAAAIEESGADGMLLVQDYHFALLPRMVREQAPHLVTSLFWHIPWPSADVVDICPWREALLEGMLGADVVGFHTREYCLNFIATAQRHLECRADLEEMSLTFGGRRTLVRPYPISVEWPYPAASRESGLALRRTLGIGEDVHVCLGVDRVDYTKGLIERVAAVAILLEENPALRGKFVLVQLGSPTRTRIDRYQRLAGELRTAVEDVNRRFGNDSWSPIVFQYRTFAPEEVRAHYAMADSALVTPLHDGMNLVAKEYVASRDDEDGVLVLSAFAGAARELRGALMVNPYDSEEMAQALLRATAMPRAERRARMRAMRDHIATHSIDHWSESVLSDMRRVKDERDAFWPRRDDRSRATAMTEVAR